MAVLNFTEIRSSTIHTEANSISRNSRKTRTQKYDPRFWNRSNSSMRAIPVSVPFGNGYPPHFTQFAREIAIENYIESGAQTLFRKALENQVLKSNHLFFFTTNRINSVTQATHAFFCKTSVPKWLSPIHGETIVLGGCAPCHWSQFCGPVV